MSRGIHLKRLTKNDLGLLGLPEQSPASASMTPAHPLATAPGRLASFERPRIAAPPPNPIRALDQDPENDGYDLDLDRALELELAALAREIRSGLEETLRLLPSGDRGHWPIRHG